MMENIYEILSYFFLVTGVFFLLTGAIGIVRMPDLFTRLHPAGVADSAGLPLILLGLLFHLDFGLVSLKIILLMIFALITSATACHALAKSAFIAKKPQEKKKVSRK